MPVAIGIGPAFANNVSFGYRGSGVSYTDATDNVCVRAANDTAGNDSAYAVVLRNGSTVATSPMAG